MTTYQMDKNHKTQQDTSLKEMNYVLISLIIYQITIKQEIIIEMITVSR